MGFCNWLESEPWRWNYRVIWGGIQGDPHWLRKLWWTVSFPHVHHDDEEEDNFPWGPVMVNRRRRALMKSYDGRRWLATRWKRASMAIYEWLWP